MIKSYKIILTAQFFALAVFAFVFYTIQYGNDFAVIPTIPLLLMGLSPLILLGISILIQRLIAAIIYSDSAENDEEKKSEDQFWKISYVTNVVFGALVFLLSVFCVAVNFGIGIKGNYDFGVKFSVFLALIIIASFIIGVFLRIKQSVNEVSKLLGGLMIFLSLIVSGGPLFFGLQNMITLQHYSNEVIEAIKTVPEVDETSISIDSTAIAIDSFAVDSLRAAQQRAMEDLGEPEDYYGIKDFSYPELEREVHTTEVFDGKYRETETLFKLFMSDFLRLKKRQSFMEIRRAIHVGLSHKQYPEIVQKIKVLRYNSNDIEDAFNSCYPLIYAIVSDKIYYDSNLNLLVDALIKSYDDLDDEALNKIYGIMVTGTKKEFPAYYFERLKPYVSKDVLQLIKKNADEDTENEYSTQLTTVWIYSFWARRNKERNMSVIYDNLKHMQSHYARDPE